MAEAFICDAIRTPIGRYGGALSSIRADDLAALPLKALMERNAGVDWAALDDVILGCANQAGEDNRNVARMASLLAGLPETVGGATINRLCGSGLDAVGTAARAIRSGDADFVIAGGVESMSRAPFVMPKATSAFTRDNTVYDTTIGWRFWPAPSRWSTRSYCVGGPYGRLLDAEVEHLGTADVQAFEIEGLVGTGAAPAVLSYLFHRIGDRLDGRPTLLIIDEGWLALDDDGFSGQLREWLKTLRKKNASVIFATQSLSDIDGSNIAPAIIESCPTRLLLPNERAIEPQITAIYRRFGLNDRQIEILARATPKRDYYCQSRRGNRLFDLGLSEVGLALCAASSKSDQTMIAEILATHGRDGFLDVWLRAHGVDWAADLIPHLTNLADDPEETAPVTILDDGFNFTLEEEEITP